MAVFLLVPGAWLGGWCWGDVASRLQADGHIVISVTLTGVGERAHLCGPTVGLHTHVSDIVGILRDRDLSDAVLVGHSYGGTVITAAAEQAPDRIRCLVYLDGSVPCDGESNNDVVGPRIAEQLRSAAQSGGQGWMVPADPAVADGLPHATRAWVQQRLTPHPLRCFEEPVRLRSTAAGALPRAFVRTTQSALYDRLLERARASGWCCREFTGGHYAMLTEPRALAAVLAELAGVL
jgi:pimeloyl-ACP methyl ester carboxylesterase